MGTRTASVFRNDEITALLRAKATDPVNGELEGSSAVKGTCDVSYAIFLEPREDTDPSWSTIEWLADVAIRKFSPSPVLAHCELVTPPIPDSSGGRVHFATYLGRGGADWQNMRSKEDGISFYLIENGFRWRAVPIFGPNAANHVREAAQNNLHAPYSVSMYATSAAPFRGMAWLWKDGPKHMGHCATITARVLKAAGIGGALGKPSAWYSPSSLYGDLLASMSTPIGEDDRRQLTSMTPETCERTIETLLRAPMSYATVRELGDAACIDAIRALTLRVLSTAHAGDDTASRIAQKQLGSALLRWCLLREDPAVDVNNLHVASEAEADAAPSHELI